MAAYYNEIDEYAAQWLRNLIAKGLIAPGDVDTRSIVDVRADDLKGYEQCHFFAGIGGWSHALRLAGWDDARPVWTGSCPCQPFSAAGKGKAADDERHLAPAWLSLIAECGPRVVFGEQVEAAIGWGWLDFVFDALEAQSYTCGAAVLPACGVGAPHIRQRLYFVADSDAGHAASTRDAGSEEGERLQARPDAGRCGRALELADASGERRQQIGRGSPGDESADGRGPKGNHVAAGHGEGDMANAERERGRGREPGSEDAGDARQPVQAGFWSDVIWLPCRDGKARPTKPGLFPLAHGVPARVGKLRAAGNAISPQVGEAFIRAYDRRVTA